MEILNSLLNVLKVAFGLGFVIFLHELGHFLLAKWNGVKVEKFSIGFGRTLLGFRRGETEYVLAAIPLGGFVKMLGENPEEEASKTTDPRAFPNKSVGARMAIISAGVIMNVFLGLACFVYAYGHGMDEVPAIIGAVKAGSPAYRAGIHAGDEVISLDGRGEMNFKTMNMSILHSAAGQKLHFELRRPGVDQPVAVDVEPVREDSSPYPRVGVLATSSLRLAKPPFERPIGMEMAANVVQKLDLQPNDVLVAIGAEGAEPTPIHDALEMQRLLAAGRAHPIVLVFDRAVEEAKSEAAKQSRQVKVTLPPNHVVDLGIRMPIGPIVSIRPDSPALKAGFQEGDRIVGFDGQEDLDPMRLPDLCNEHAGKEVSFVVERINKEGKKERVNLTAVPDASSPWPEIPGTPQEIPGLGLAYSVGNKVLAVREGSPAAKAGVLVGDEVTQFKFLPPAKEEKASPITLNLDAKSPDWPFAFSYMQIQGDWDFELTVKRANKSLKPFKIKPEPVADWFLPSRGLQFRELVRRLPPQGAWSSLRRGADDTLDNILKIYALLRSLAQSRVSPKLLGGPIMIAQAAYSQAETGLTELVHFLGLLSINLAVLNFLPIPPLDGGQMVFLIAEKVRGKPLPESAVVAGSWVGIIMLVCLMGYVMFQDVLRSF